MCCCVICQLWYDSPGDYGYPSPPSFWSSPRRTVATTGLTNAPVACGNVNFNCAVPPNAKLDLSKYPQLAAAGIDTRCMSCDMPTADDRQGVKLIMSIGDHFFTHPSLDSVPTAHHTTTSYTSRSHHGSRRAGLGWTGLDWTGSQARQMHVSMPM